MLPTEEKLEENQELEIHRASNGSYIHRIYGYCKNGILKSQIFELVAVK